jgi:hypothetical protein
MPGPERDVGPGAREFHFAGTHIRVRSSRGKVLLPPRSEQFDTTIDGFLVEIENLLCVAAIDMYRVADIGSEQRGRHRHRSEAACTDA